MDVLDKLLDAVYGFVKREGDFSLQFMADFIRGPSTNKKDSVKKTKSQAPLTDDEEKVFQELLQRKQGEEQVAYWKRKKAMLNMDNKKEFVRAEIQSRKSQAKLESLQSLKDEQKKKRNLEMQTNRMKSAKNRASQKRTYQHKAR